MVEYFFFKFRKYDRYLNYKKSFVYQQEEFILFSMSHIENLIT